MGKQCKICGQPQKDDLFSFVTQEPVCTVCKIKYIGGLPTTQNRIESARKALGLKDGEYLSQNYGEECARMLGRKNN